MNKFHVISKGCSNSLQQKFKKDWKLWHRFIDKLLLSSIIFIFCLCENNTGNAHGVIYVQSPGKGKDIGPNLKDAWEKASERDVILLPTGDFRIDTPLSFNLSNKNNIHIEGAGSGSGGTRLYRASQTFEYMMVFYGGSEEAEIEISNIWFQAMKTRVYDGDDGTSYELFRGLAFRSCDFYLHDCRFQYFSNIAVSVRHPQRHGSGVISNNEFLQNLSLDADGKFSKGYAIGVSVWGDLNEWVPVSLGTDNFVFIEDNYFSRMRPAVASGMGAMVVFRYNHCEQGSSESAYLDMHPGRPPWLTEAYSSRFMAVYENTFINLPNDDPMYEPPYNYGAISFRGGASIIFNNTFRNYNDLGVIELTAYDRWADRPAATADYKFPGYPIPYQIGYKSGLKYGASHSGLNPTEYGEDDCFIWNNSFENSNAKKVEIIDEGILVWEGVEYDMLEEGRDYHFAPKPEYKPYSYPHPRRSSFKIK